LCNAEAVAVDSPNPSPARYVVPQSLRDVELIDMLELTGSATRAAALLHLSQPTVSRRYQGIARDLGLTRRSRNDPGLRFGDSPSLRLMRQALNLHRWQAGQLRVGCRRGLESALTSLPQLQVVELDHHPPGSWWELVTHQLLDGLVLDEGAAGADGAVAGDGVAIGDGPSTVALALAVRHRQPLRLLCRRHGPILAVLERLGHAGNVAGVCAGAGGGPMAGQLARRALR
jgi:hypothetical protein